MTSWIGADTAELRSLGETFADQAVLLDRAAATLTGRMTSLAWHGGDLELFHDNWTRQHKVAVTAAAALLRLQRDTLGRNADDQDRASGAEGGSTGAPTPGGPGPSGGTGAGPLDADALKDDLVSALGGTPVQQQEWWDGLTDAERALLLTTNPSLLAQLGDGVLTDLEAQTVTEALLDRAAGQTTLSQVMNELSVKGRVGWFTFGAAGEMGVSQRADGTFVVTLTGELAAGAEFGDAKTTGGGVTLTGGLSTSYVFGSQAEADAFVDAMVHALIPEWEGQEAVNLANGTYVTAEYEQALQGYADNHQKTTAFVELEGKVSVGISDDFKVEVNGGAKFEQNLTDGSRTYTLSAEVAAKAAVGGTLGVDIGVKTDSDNNLTSLTLRADASVSANGDVKLPFGELKDPTSLPGPDNPQSSNVTSKVSTAATGSATMTVNLENPENRRLAGEYLAAVAGEDYVAAAAIQDKLVHDAQVSLQVGLKGSVTDGIDLDLKALEIKAGSSVQTNQVWVKVEGSDEYVWMNGSDRT